MSAKKYKRSYSPASTTPSTVAGSACSPETPDTPEAPETPPLEPTEVTFSLSPSYGIHGAREAHDWFLLMMGEKERGVLILVAFMRSPIHL